MTEDKCRAEEAERGALDLAAAELEESGCAARDSAAAAWAREEAAVESEAKVAALEAALCRAKIERDEATREAREARDGAEAEAARVTAALKEKERVKARTAEAAEASAEAAGAQAVACAEFYSVARNVARARNVLRDAEGLRPLQLPRTGAQLDAVARRASKAQQKAAALKDASAADVARRAAAADKFDWLYRVDEKKTCGFFAKSGDGLWIPFATSAALVKDAAFVAAAPFLANKAPETALSNVSNVLKGRMEAKGPVELCYWPPEEATDALIELANRVFPRKPTKRLAETAAAAPAAAAPSSPARSSSQANVVRSDSARKARRSGRGRGG